MRYFRECLENKQKNPPHCKSMQRGGFIFMSNLKSNLSFLLLAQPLLSS